VRRIEEYRLMVTRSKWFLELAREAHQKQRYDIAVFLAEQAVQLRIKAALLHLAGYHPRIHGIRLLLGELRRISGKETGDRIEEFIREHRSLLSELEDAYLIARYAPKQYDREDSEALITIAEKTLSLIERVEGGESREPASGKG